MQDWNIIWFSSKVMYKIKELDLHGLAIHSGDMLCCIPLSDLAISFEVSLRMALYQLKTTIVLN